ncbi:transglutaminase-like cysteine peptidase [Caulobacter segnis]|uniref:transglutaminase-like cysteine peptidase n=1 Tax=Caulobacter segnis TaxID=88688 RepID=UPI001CBC7AC5|nr:transglutaminase-like cysteine peptidase [Caulobacter segnis]UAL10887.1 transglutaminase-like cysteine peptidase [Caulobacter segnis]
MFNTRNTVIGIAATVAMMTGASAQAGSMPFMPRGEGVSAPMGFADLCRRDTETCGLPNSQLALLGVGPNVSLVPTSSVGGASQYHREVDPKTAAEDARPTPVEASSAVAVEDAGQPREALSAAVPVAATIVAAVTEPAVSAWGARGERDQLKLLNQINQSVNREVKKASDLDIYGMPEYWSLPRLIDGKLYGDCEDYALEKRRRLIAAGVPESALSLAVAVTARGEGHAVLMISLKSGDVVLDNLTPWATPWEDLNYHWVQRQVPGTALWTTAV